MSNLLTTGIALGYDGCMTKEEQYIYKCLSSASSLKTLPRWKQIYIYIYIFSQRPRAMAVVSRRFDIRTPA